MDNLKYFYEKQIIMTIFNKKFIKFDTKVFYW